MSNISDELRISKVKGIPPKETPTWTFGKVTELTGQLIETTKSPSYFKYKNKDYRITMEPSIAGGFITSLYFKRLVKAQIEFETQGEALAQINEWAKVIKDELE